MAKRKAKVQAPPTEAQRPSRPPRFRVQWSGGSSVKRVSDASEINRILNAPEVFNSLSAPGIEKFDLTEAASKESNVFLLVEGGCILFFCLMPGLYDVHLAFLPPYRGRYALDATRAAFRWIFTHTDCMRIVTRVPETSRAVLWFARKLGASRDFVRSEMWPTEAGMKAIEGWSLGYHGWIRGLGGDPIETRTAICFEMLQGGQPDKGALLYNQFAVYAGLPQMALLARAPVLVRFNGELMQVHPIGRKITVIRTN